jgi:short-subunit dehydrogenase
MSDKQKTIMITGATGGIGSAITQILLNNNHKVIGWGRKPCLIPGLIQNNNYQHHICDFGNPEAAEKAAKELFKTLSLRSLSIKSLPGIDALILAAGFGQFNELEQFSLKQMQNLMNVNFISQAVITKTVLPLIKKSANSKIIAIASESALVGARKGSLYCASKFALRGFMQSLRAECTQSETAVTIVNPGLVNTNFFNNLAFRPGNYESNFITPKQIAKILAMILDMENNCIFEEINLQPLKKVIQKQ